MNDKRIAIYHRVYRRENFEKAAQDLFGLIRAAQKQSPNTSRALYVDIDGHRKANGDYDEDMQELQNEFATNVLLQFVKEAHFSGVSYENKGEQNNNIPDKLLIGNERNEKDDNLEKLYIENYSNTEFMSEDDVYQYMKEVSDFLKDYNNIATWNYENYTYDDKGYLKMWKKHIDELIIELFNSFIHGNFLSVAAMTRTLIECYILVSIMKNEHSQQLLDEWWLCNVIHKAKLKDTVKAENSQVDYIKKYCQERNIDFEEKWKYYTEYAKKENGWLRTIQGDKGIGFKELCKYINEEEVYIDYESASSYVHGQDIATKIGPFTFYSSIYIRLYLMIQYIFKAIRLFATDEKMEEKMDELEGELIQLGEKYLK